MRKISTRMWVHEDSMRMMGARLALRMTIVKLSDDGLWICTPTAHNPQLQNRVAEMGEVKYIVASSNGHNLFLEAWKNAFPNAAVYVAARIPGKRSELAGCAFLRDLEIPPWHEDLQMYRMDGVPFFDEHMFIHGKSNTLLVTDYFQNYTGTKQKGLGKIVSKLIFEPIGFKGKCLAPPLKTKFMVKDRQALKASLDRLWELDIERVVPAHGDIFEEDAKQVIRGLCQRFYE